jgi:hypothetical protein
VDCDWAAPAVLTTGCEGDEVGEDEGGGFAQPANASAASHAAPLAMAAGLK